VPVITKGITSKKMGIRNIGSVPVFDRRHEGERPQRGTALSFRPNASRQCIGQPIRTLRYSLSLHLHVAVAVSCASRRPSGDPRVASSDKEEELHHEDRDDGEGCADLPYGI
jgi:hypothetical protein